MKLSDYAWNSYSQYGEDGVINQILQELHVSHGTCVEFGAADGFFCSNTASLWMAGWDALLIESDPECVAALTQNTESYPNVSILQARVESVDAHVPEPVTVLSMDVDGNEWYLLRDMEVVHRVLVIEHNPTVPPQVEMVGPQDTKTGASALSLVKLAESKDYHLVAATDTNVIFVCDDDWWAFEDYDTDLESIFIPSHLNYIITDYEGGYQEIGTFPYGKTQEVKLV